ncbi:MAG: T6SS immunity protein Tli4 family protein, partial [Duganella sp.]
VKILSQLRGLPNAELPSESGFCFDHGIVLDPLAAAQSEYTGAFIGMEDNPDLSISISTSAGLKSGRTLLQRNSGNSVQASYRSHFNTLRIGERSINRIPGEEVLHRVDELNGSVGHGFMWESLGTQNDVYLPNISLELTTGIGRPGKPVNSSLSDNEAITLWDKISSSLRPRPIDRKSDSNSI